MSNLITRRLPFSVAASQTDAVLLEAMPGYRYRVLGFILSARGTATAVTFNEKAGSNAGVAVSQQFNVPAATPFELPIETRGWFETATQGNALTLTTGSGATVDGTLVYGVIQEALPNPPSQQVVTRFSVVPSTTTPTTGVGFTVTVTALDASNTTVTTYAGTVHLTSSDGGATLGADAGLTGGVGTFAVTLVATGGQTVTATDISTAASGTATVTVQPLAARQKLAFGTQPAAANAGATLAAFTVRLTDAAGDLVATDSTSQVVLSIVNAAGATVGGTLTQTCSAGVATFSDITVDLAGTYLFYAQVSGVMQPFVAAAVSAEFAISQPAYANLGAAPNVQAWYDFSDNTTVLKSGGGQATAGSTTTGDVIVTLNDKSSHARNGSGHGIVRYHSAGINGLNTGYADGSTGYIEADAVAAAFSGTKYGTVYAVVKFPSTPAASSAIWGMINAAGIAGSTGTWDAYWDHASGKWMTFRQNDALTIKTLAGSAADTNAHIIGVHLYPDGTGVIEVDGFLVADFIDESGATTLTTFALFAQIDSGGAASFANCDIGEVGCAQPGHNYAQRQAVYQMLGAKWGITVRRAALTYYFDPAAGSDGNAGTSSGTPKQTAAAQRGLTLYYGDVVRCKAGGAMNGYLQLAPAFQDNNASPLVLSTYGGTGQAVVQSGNASGVVTDDCPGASVFNVAPNGAAISLSFSGGAWHSSTTNLGAGLQAVNRRGAAKLKGPYVYNFSPTGYQFGLEILADAGGSNTIGFTGGCVLNSTVSEILLFGFFISGLTTNNAQGMHTNFLFADCNTFNCYGDSTGLVVSAGSGFPYFIAGTDNFTMNRCVGHDCGKAAHFGTSLFEILNCRNWVVSCCEGYNLADPASTDGECFLIDSGCDNGVFQFCYSHDNAGPGLFVGGNVVYPVLGTNTFRYCISQNDGKSSSGTGAAVYSQGAENCGTVYMIGCTVYCSSPLNGFVVDNHATTGGTWQIADCIFIARGGAAFANLKTGTVWVNNLYDTDGTFALTYAGTNYASLTAIHTAAIANFEKVGATTYGVQNVAGLLNAGGATAQMPTNLTPNNLTDYDVGVGSAAYQAGIDLSSVLSIIDQTLDFHGNLNKVSNKWDIGAVKRQV